MATRALSCATALTMYVGSVAIADVPLIGLTWGGELYDIDASTGAASNPRSTGDVAMIGIADTPTNSLYTISTGLAATPHALLRIDAQTGATQYSGDTGEAMAEGDLDFDPVSGMLFATHPTAGAILLTVDTVTGQSFRVGLVPGASDLSAMAFTDDGSLYMLDTTQDVLYRVDPADASVISSVNVSHNFHVLAGMDFHPDTGVLYVADGDGSFDLRTLYTLDISTGNTTEVGHIANIRGISGLRFVPEPATALLLACGALVGIGRRRPDRH